jgi:pimeloyl-ACP methyl ester carboxylesterase
VALDQTLTVLPKSPAGRRAAWVLQRLLAVALGTAVPDSGELEEHYAQEWLSEIPMAAIFGEQAPVMTAVTGARLEVAAPHEVRAVLDFSDGSAMRFRCVVQASPPHQIVFQLFSPAMAPSGYVDRVVQHNGRSVHIRDFGGDGPLLLLWHGSGCDATAWEAMVPHLRSFRVVAQDLPGHGGSPLPRLSVADAVADGRAVLTHLGLGEPILVGHSMGGWAALHYAATNPCRALVCLDGPATLEYAEMGLQPDHPGFVPDPPDVRADLGSLRCPALIVLCRGESPLTAQSMVPFRSRLSEHVAMKHPQIRVEWRSTGHMLILSQPDQTAGLVRQFGLDV